MICLQEVVDGSRYYVGITEGLGRCGVLQLDLSPSVLRRQMLPAFGNTTQHVTDKALPVWAL